MVDKSIYAQKVPCATCPFLKEGGVRHGAAQARAYASYFLTEPGTTFPCHKSVPKDDPRTDWSPWQAGQVLCAGGLLFAAKHGIENGLVRFGRERGWYDPATHTPEQLSLVFEDVATMVRAHGSIFDRPAR